MTTSDPCPPRLAVGVTRDRVARLTPEARTLHRQVLQWFASTGQAPDRAELAVVAPGRNLDELLRELHDHDVVRLDSHSAISAAYPFSATPTAHAVAIANGPNSYAMCAIDALGMAAMLRSDLRVTSMDPSSNEQITVDVHDGLQTWTPHDAVVLVGTQDAVAANDCCGPQPPLDTQTCRSPAADRSCGVMNFFSSDHNANAWLEQHPNVTGTVLTGRQAFQLGADIFGHLLDD